MQGRLNYSTVHTLLAGRCVQNTCTCRLLRSAATTEERGTHIRTLTTAWIMWGTAAPTCSAGKLQHHVLGQQYLLARAIASPQCNSRLLDVIASTRGAHFQCQVSLSLSQARQLPSPPGAAVSCQVLHRIR
jgi:hypothetical protein